MFPAIKIHINLSNKAISIQAKSRTGGEPYRKSENFREESLAEVEG